MTTDSFVDNVLILQSISQLGIINNSANSFDWQVTITNPLEGTTGVISSGTEPGAGAKRDWNAADKIGTTIRPYCEWNIAFKSTVIGMPATVDYVFSGIT